jgi:hypothetical protein
MSVTVLVMNVATSVVTLGGPFADQFEALFQTPVSGLIFHVALPARIFPVQKTSSVAAARNQQSFLRGAFIMRGSYVFSTGRARKVEALCHSERSRGISHLQPKRE